MESLVDVKTLQELEEYGIDPLAALRRYVLWIRLDRVWTQCYEAYMTELKDCLYDRFIVYKYDVCCIYDGKQKYDEEFMNNFGKTFVEVSNFEWSKYTNARLRNEIEITKGSTIIKALFDPCVTARLYELVFESKVKSLKKQNIYINMDRVINEAHQERWIIELASHGFFDVMITEQEPQERNVIDTIKYSYKDLITSAQENLEFTYGFKNVLESDIYTEEVAREHKLIMVLGVPGAGKSQIARSLSCKVHARLIDSNVVKTFFPKFIDNPANASMVHEESSNIAKNIYEECIFNGENIIYLKVGDQVDKIEYLLNMARDRDYEITLIYVETFCYMAQARVLRRFLQTRFYVNPKLVSSYYNEDSTCKVKDTFNALKSKVDHYIRYKNNRVKEPMVIVEESY